MRPAGWLLLPMIGVAVTMMVPVGKDTAGRRRRSWGIINYQGMRRSYRDPIKIWLLVTE